MFVLTLLFHAGLDLVLAMLAEEPSKRISAQRALTHPFIARGKSQMRYVGLRTSKGHHSRRVPAAAPDQTACGSNILAGTYRAYATLQ